MPLSTYWRNKVLDKLFGSTDFTPPASIYIGLSTSSPSADGTGVTEPSVGSYARVAVTNDKVNFSDAASGALTNDAQITFPTATADWGTVTHIVGYDASSSGNLLFYQALASSVAVANGEQPYFAAGDLDVTGS